MNSRMVKLGEVAGINPRSNSRDTLEDNSIVSFVSMSDISDKTFRIETETEARLEKVKKGYTAFERGDVLLAKITPCFENGKLAIANIQNQFGFGSTEFHVIRPYKNQLNAQFLYHFLRQEKIRIDGEKKMTGSAGQRRVPRHFLETLEIPLPSLEEQQKIAAVLDAVDSLLVKRREGLKKLEELLKSVFLEMFGDPVTNPKGWETSKLGKTFATKPLIGTMTPASEFGNLKVVRVGELGQFEVDLERCKFIERNSQDLKKYSLQTGDFLLARAIGSEDHLGKSSVIHELKEDIIFDSHVMRLRFNRTANPIFFYHWLKSHGGRNLFMRKAGRTAVQFNVNGTQIADIDIPLPDIETQNHFASVVNSIYKKSIMIQSSLDSLEKLFAAIQHQAFNGTLTAAVLGHEVGKLETEIQAGLF